MNEATGNSIDKTISIFRQITIYHHTITNQYFAELMDLTSLHTDQPIGLASMCDLSRSQTSTALVKP